jgi:hypothetical protein
MRVFNLSPANMHLSWYYLKITMVLAIGWTFFAVPSYSQLVKIAGTVRDEISMAPIKDVNITVNGTTQGTVTDKEGRFFLLVEKLPSAITLSCIGYETVYFEISRHVAKPLELIMRSRVYSLSEVEIPSTRFSYVFKDPNYSVLDYEIMDDNILLLIFRYQLQRSELVLLSLTGDTLAITALPEMKPKRLYKDFLGFVHYVSTHGNAFQCYYSDTLKRFGFLYKTTFDSLVRLVEPFLFSANDRFYFQEYTTDGFGTNIGYYDKNQKKVYIRFVSGESTRKSYSRDMEHYRRFNDQLQKTTVQLALSPFETHNKSQPLVDNSGMRKQPTVDEYDILAINQFSYRKINAPLVRLGESNMAVFNFTDDVIEHMEMTGKVYKSVPVSFHKEADNNLLASLFIALAPVEWKWRGKILVDEYYRNAYTSFQKNGVIQLKKINLETGKLTTTVELPFPSPEKITIYKGNAYFLVRETGHGVYWRLIKVRM